jgi:hypothetical protein
MAKHFAPLESDLGMVEVLIILSLVSRFITGGPLLCHLVDSLDRLVPITFFWLGATRYRLLGSPYMYHCESR